MKRRSERRRLLTLPTTWLFERRGNLVAQPATWLFLVSSIVIVASFRLMLGTDDWAGLGQWVGGLGALYAAGVALYIANGDRRRERVREDERFRTHAHYHSG